MPIKLLAILLIGLPSQNSGYSLLCIEVVIQLCNDFSMQWKLGGSLAFWPSKVSASKMVLYLLF